MPTKTIVDTDSPQTLTNKTLTGPTIINPGGDFSSASVKATGSTFARSIANHVGDVINVKDFGARGDTLTDDTISLQAALNVAMATPESTLFIPSGTYTTTAPLSGENSFGLRIIGGSRVGATINAQHSGKAILSLVGARAAEASYLHLTGGQSTRPATGLLLGRSSSASAGYHSFRDLFIDGSFAHTGLYCIASEENLFENLLIVTTDAPNAAAYISYTDSLGIGGLVASSMSQLHFTRCSFYQYDATAGNTNLNINFNNSTGHLYFTNLYLAKQGGDSFVNFKLDAYLQDVTFNGLAGEVINSGPTNGLHIKGTSGMHCQHLIMDPVALAATTNAILCDTGVGQFQNSRIHWTQAIDGQVMSLNAAYGSDLRFMNNGPVTFTNGVYSSTLVYTGTFPTIGTSRAGSIIRKFVDTTVALQVAGDRLHLPVVPTASLPAAGAVEDGSTLIEDNGTGDRNLVIYSGGQRFRIDGGAAF